MKRCESPHHTVPRTTIACLLQRNYTIPFHTPGREHFILAKPKKPSVTEQTEIRTVIYTDSFPLSSSYDLRFGFVLDFFWYTEAS